MSISHRYRNFGGARSPSQVKDDPALEAIEDQKLQAFEAGYQAGWDDAMKAQSEAKGKLSDELNQSLQDISFSYREAVAKVSSSMHPIVREIVEKLLPEMMRTGLSAHVVEQLKNMMNDELDRSVELVVAPFNVGLVMDLVDEKMREQVQVVSDEAVKDGEAFIRIDQTERQIDLAGVVDGVSKAMKAFFHETAEQINNG